jgi:hypothetical protein
MKNKRTESLIDNYIIKDSFLNSNRIENIKPKDDLFQDDYTFMTQIRK